MPNFPIRNGSFNIPPGLLRRAAGITVTNTSPANPATVTINAPDGSEVWSCQLAGNGKAAWHGINSADLQPGAYTVTVTGTVTGQLTTT